MRSKYYKGILWKKYINSIYKELFRKAIHLCTAFIPLLLSHFYWLTIILLSLALVGYSLSEVLRLKGINIPLVSNITVIASRNRDDGKIVKGPIFLVIGIILTALVWKGIPSTVGIFALAFGDGLASLSGKMFGKLQIPFTSGKTVAGSLTCFTAILYSTFFTLHDMRLALIIAFSGMLIEVLPLKDFDNLIIPFVIAGLTFLLLP